MSTRCIEGRLWRHDPQPDDPDLETNIGRCPKCDGRGCSVDHDPASEVTIDYTNWQGRRSTRRITPSRSMWFGSNEWHPEPQWLLLAFDEERREYRTFALRNIHSWEPAVTLEARTAPAPSERETAT